MRKNFTDELTPRQILEIDACTGCGECLKHCPVQNVSGVDGNPSISPPEKIRMFRELIRGSEGLKAMLFGPREADRKLLEDFASAVFECTTCGACGENCPVGINTQRLWTTLRKELVEHGLAPLDQLPPWSKSITASGNLYGKPVAERYKPSFPDGIKVVDCADVAYYAGCTPTLVTHPINQGDINVLAAIGEPFCMLPPEEEVCCGFPLFTNGLDFPLLKDLTKRLVEGFRAKGVKVLIASCPCCVYIMANHWPEFYGKPLPFKIRHISQYALEAIRQGKLKLNKRLDERLIYHDPCYLTRGVGVVEEPREVLRSIPGVKLLEFERHGFNSRCCGVAGALRLLHPQKSTDVANLVIDEAVEKKADRLILSCPACYNSLNVALQGSKNQDKIKITDIMELVGGLI